jgi:hypothetical protein
VQYNTMGGVIYWVRTWKAGGDELIPMYYKGRCDRADEGAFILGKDHIDYLYRLPGYDEAQWEVTREEAN